ncbi:MAG TPA: hypothetical protein VJW23_12065 [Propionibacteriaceae bacterium]|nr:hypothetical protein [Propionibacteriaceae bacterium]
MLPLVTMPTTPPGESPRFEFSLFVPALSYNGGWPKCYSKGHLEPKYYGKRVRYVDSDEVYAWVNHIVSHATARRLQLQRTGYNPFPYREAVQVRAIFVFNRPHTQPEGPPTIHASNYAIGDTDGLQKALGDAIVAGTKNAKFPKAGIIEDDRLIVRWLDPQKAFADQIDWEDRKPAAGVWFRIEPYDDEPIKISNFV